MWERVGNISGEGSVLGYKGKWGPLSQPCKLGDGPRLMADPEYIRAGGETSSRAGNVIDQDLGNSPSARSPRWG